LSYNTSAAPGSLTTHTVKQENVAKEYLLDAVVEAINISTVSAETSGRITKINFDIGDFVKAGSVLVLITKAEQQAAAAAAEAQVFEAEARLQEAQDEFERVKGVYERKLVAKSAMDKAAADLKAAQQRVKAANANLKQAEERLQYTTVKAPYSGYVVSREVDLGEMVAPGKPVMTGLSLKELRVAADVPQSLIHYVRDAKQMRFVFPQLDNREVVSNKIRVSPKAKVPAHTFLVRAYLPENPLNLYPGMFAKMAIVTGAKTSIRIPEEALVRRSELTAVYVVDETQHILLRQVRAGSRVGDEVEILAGLQAGEQIALNPVEAGILLKEQRAQPQSAK
jgi:RND family efflux transporter MFP subunit